MEKGREYLEQEIWRQSLKGHEKDAGYVERFGINEQARSSHIFGKMVGSIIGIGLLIYVIIVLHFDWVKEGFIAAMVAGFLGLIFYVWRIFKKLRRQDRMYDDAVNRQEHGIDVRFGRTGADRKKK